MATKELVKKEAGVSPFVIFETPVQEIHDAVAANLGDDKPSASDFERIKIPAGGGTAWTTQTLDGEELVKELTGIIVAWRDTRAYWSVPMEQSDGNSAPDCYSLDARTGNGTPGGDCLKCELSRFGSKGEPPACKQVRQLFLVREDNLLPEIVSLPPSSIKPARQYFMRLASKAVPCFSLITKISLEKTKNAQGIVYSRAVFTSGGRLTEEQSTRVKEYSSMIRPYLDAAPSAPKAADVSQETEGEVI